MAKKEETPVDVGVAPAFPPTENPPASGPIADTEPTTASEGLIGDANSTHSNLSDC